MRGEGGNEGKKNIIKIINKNSKVKQQVLQINNVLQLQNRISSEIEEYRIFIEKVLSSKFIVYTLLETFIFYLLIFTEWDQIYRILFSIIGAGHVLSLSLIISLCDKIARHNGNLSNKLLRVHNRFMFLNTLSYTKYIKFETIIESFSSFNSGFRTINLMIVDSRCYFVVSSL